MSCRYYGNLQTQEPQRSSLPALLRRLFQSHPHLVDDLLENFLEGRLFKVVGAKLLPVVSPYRLQEECFLKL